MREVNYDERRHLALLLILLILLGLFVEYHRRTTVGGYNERFATLELDLEFERNFAIDVFEENKQLREANRALRERVLDLSGNLSYVEGVVQACLTRLPSSTLANTSGIRHRIGLEDLTFTENAVVLNVRDIEPGVISPSSSMIPLLHEDTIVLEVTPHSHADIALGDIIIFDLNGVRIIHRVVKIGWDTQGWFAITRGDNNPVEDEQPVRFEQVRGIVVGIIY